MKKISRSKLAEVHGIALPVGKYRFYAAAEKVDVFEVKDDTEGCILVGTSIVNEDFIGNSRAAFNRLFDVMDDAYNRGEQIWITVE